MNQSLLSVDVNLRANTAKTDTWPVRMSASVCQSDSMEQVDEDKKVEGEGLEEEEEDGFVRALR